MLGTPELADDKGLSEAHLIAVIAVCCNKGVSDPHVSLRAPVPLAARDQKVTRPGGP